MVDSSRQKTNISCFTMVQAATLALHSVKLQTSVSVHTVSTLFCKLDLRNLKVKELLYVFKESACQRQIACERFNNHQK